MSFADELRRNYNPPEELYYFKEIKYIIRTIKECASYNSANSHHLSGYYSHGGYEEYEGIYADTTHAVVWYFHPEDFGVYKDRIACHDHHKKEEVIAVKNVEKALKEIKEILIREGFKNVIVEERKIGEAKVCYNTRNMTFWERQKANHRSWDYHTYKRGEQCGDYVKMPIYCLYISIDW